MTDKSEQQKDRQQETETSVPTATETNNNKSETNQGQMEFDAKRGVWITRTPYGSFEWNESTKNWIPLVKFSINSSKIFYIS
jgi:hypothetical protein